MTRTSTSLLALALLSPLWGCGDKADDPEGSDPQDTGSLGDDGGGDDGGGDDGGETSDAELGLEVGDLAPDFTLIDKDGANVSLSDSDGAPRLIVGTAGW